MDRREDYCKRDYNYYETHAADVNLEDITSDADNAEILGRLRNDNVESLSLYESAVGGDSDFVFREGDDLGWLGYFLGKSKQLKEIWIAHLPEKREQTDELIDGLTRNQSIEKLVLWHHLIKELGPSAAFRNKPKLHDFELQFPDGFESEDARILSSMLSFMSLKSFRIEGFEDALMDADDNLAEIISALSEHSQLKELGFKHGNLGRTSCQALGAYASNLVELDLKYCNINDEGLKLIAAGIDFSSFLSTLNLGGNEISDAGMRSLSTALESTNCIDYLDLSCNSIGDKGLQALVKGLTNCVELQTLNLSVNRSITSAGLRSMSPFLQSERCSLKKLSLRGINFGDDGAIALADGLVGNHSLKILSIDLNSFSLVMWSAFARLLCDTSSINKTYLSNHTLEHIGSKCIKLNKCQHQKDSAKCKILSCHSDFDMEPLFQWKLKFLPLVVNWFDPARFWAHEVDWKNISESPHFVPAENEDVIAKIRRRRRDLSSQLGSRKLSAVYQFIRGMPMLTVGQIMMTHTCTRKRKIDQLEK